MSGRVEVEVRMPRNDSGARHDVNHAKKKD